MSKPQNKVRVHASGVEVIDFNKDLVKSELEKLRKETNMKTPLKGFIQSGLLYIGDPVYMSGDTREEVEDPYNPFRNWDGFTQGLDGQDANLAFPGSQAGTEGRGCAIQTGTLSGKYEIEKQYDEAGRLAQIIIKVLP